MAKKVTKASLEGDIQNLLQEMREQVVALNTMAQILTATEKNLEGEQYAHGELRQERAEMEEELTGLRNLGERLVADKRMLADRVERLVESVKHHSDLHGRDALEKGQFQGLISALAYMLVRAVPSTPEGFLHSFRHAADAMLVEVSPEMIEQLDLGMVKAHGECWHEVSKGFKNSKPLADVLSKVDAGERVTPDEILDAVLSMAQK